MHASKRHHPLKRPAYLFFVPLVLRQRLLLPPQPWLHDVRNHGPVQIPHADGPFCRAAFNTARRTDRFLAQPRFELRAEIRQPASTFQVLVASHTLRQADHQDVTIVGENLTGSLDQLRQQPGKNIWLFGGGSLFRSSLDARQVDANEVAVIPVLLGGGLPFLPPSAKQAALKWISSKTYKTTGTIALEYAVSSKPRVRHSGRPC